MPQIVRFSLCYSVTIDTNGGKRRNMNLQNMKRLFTMSVLSVLILSFVSAAASPAAHAATPTSRELIAAAEKHIGTPHRLGSKAGSTKTFDCSSFTQHVFKAFDVELPRTSAAQAKVGERVPKGYLSVGDLVFFNINGRGISHVGIYAGDNKMIHVSSSRGVIIADMTTKYWSRAYVTARRVL